MTPGCWLWQHQAGGLGSEMGTTGERAWGLQVRSCIWDVPMRKCMCVEGSSLFGPGAQAGI